MRILLLTQFYWPEVRTAPTNLAAAAEFLVGRGHEVRVVTGFPCHPFGRIYDGYRQRWRQWDTVRGVRVLRLPLYPDHSLSAVRRALNYSSFALSAASIGAWLTRRFDADVVFVYLPPLTNWLPIRALQLIHRAPVVCWISDFWPDGLIAAGARVPPWLERAIGRLEQAVYRRSRLLCINSPGAGRRLAAKGVEPEKIALLGDWADETLFFPAEPEPELAHEHGLAGRFNVIYAGNLGPAQGLDTAIEAAALLADLPDLQLIFIGDGEDKPRLKRIVAERRLGNVRFIPRRPMQEIYRYLALADVLLLHLNADSMYEAQVPSKLTAYLAAARPILCGIAGDSADMVREAGAGMACTPSDPQAMARALRQLHSMPADERSRMADTGHRWYLERFTRVVLLKRIEALLAGVTAGSGGAATPS
jgi:glycosyltransferase involved in cell wall biosynthesis